MSNGTNATQHPRKPSTRAVVAAGVAVQLFFLAWGAFYYVNRPKTPVQPLLVRQVLIPEEMVYTDTDVAPKAGRRLPPVDVAKMVLGTPAQLSQGANLFKEHCVTCHGQTGRGDGPTGITLRPRPRDLTSLAGWKRGTKLTDVFRTVTLGLEGTQMSAFDYLPAEERFALAHFVTSLAAGHARPTRAEIDSLDRQFELSTGAQEPNVIPISMAMEKLAGEAKPAPAVPDSAKLAALAAKSPRGARLFGQVVRADQVERVGFWLATDSSWVGRPARLRELAMAGAPANGFRPWAELLSSDDWLSLYEYIALRYRAQ
jgi:mono/diheme cytochrome c family protein